MILEVERQDDSADSSYAGLTTLNKYRINAGSTDPKILNDIKVFNDLNNNRALGITWHSRRI